MGMGISKSDQHANSPTVYNGENRMLIDFFQNLFMRNLVSKNRRRLLVGGYDLDMSYITNHLLAMSFPFQNIGAIFRNPLSHVKTVLDMKHHGCYKVYNLCIEQSYNSSNFHGRVEVYPFEDKYVPPLSMIKRFCESVYSWLSRDSRNIAVIHCMAGKGRTGLMVCAYLVYCGMTVDEALDLYAEKRTTNIEGKANAVVFYWSKLLSFAKHPFYANAPPQVNLPRSNYRELRRNRLYDMTTNKSVFFSIFELQKLYGDIRVEFYERIVGRLFYTCFNTAFIKSSFLQLKLCDLDKVGLKGWSLCGSDFCLELLFEPVNAV
ncbi:hypothetical protein ZOSMA_19G00570 [Zostera marina]|uniref:Uncharacterized protein n=1 Tax=Zostera marina TaxID=29655 RepID=A0A0K9PQF5_ZOSMR|nr:hypothetical protein ZOSMA_19G00570 [Zostera marina]